MNILHAASELYPLLKTGGLADVLGALPFAQQQNGDNVRVILPYYRRIREQIPFTSEVFRCDSPGGYAVIRFAEYQGLGLYLIDAPHLYDRDGNPYHDGHYRDYPDNVVRFGLLGWAAAAVACGADPFWSEVDVLHAHDWQAGLAAAYLKSWGAWQVKTVFTIHNIAYQGLFEARHMADLWLPWDMYQPEGLEFNGQISFLKAGLYYADHITTVSPTYAQDITVSAYGMEGLRHLADATAKAELYAQAAGVRLGKILSIAEQANYGGPMPVFMEAKAAAPVPVASGQIALQSQVTVVYEIAD